jgi:cobalt-zinc-cadmium efflux system membrane fusion protein
MSQRLLLLGLGMLVAAACFAHEGVVHRDEQSAVPLPAAALAERPRRLPDGELFLPKAAQRLLGIRTIAWSDAATSQTLSLLAEVQAQPAAAVTLTAPEPGRLEAAQSAWPLPGQGLHAGQLLAWLRPLISQRDAARRRALVADLDQKLIIASLNVERLNMQSAVNDDNQNKVATGNIYLEEAVAERDALQRQRELIAESLRDRIPLRAPFTGRVLAAPARVGDVAAAGQVLFQFNDPSRLRLAVLSFDPGLGERLRAVHAHLGVTGDVKVAYRGQEPLSGAPGWRLLFDPVSEDDAAGNDGAASSPGQLIELHAQAVAAGAAVLPSGACAIDADGAAVVWVHRAAERFAPLRLQSCASDIALEPGGVQLAQGDRLVTQGAGLLSQYR